MNRMNFGYINGLAQLGLRLCLCIGLFSSTAAAQRVQLDRIIAMVDEDVVLQSELDLRMNDVREQATRANQPLPPEDEFRESILEALIIENLQMQFADRVSIRFDDDTINRILGNMAQNNNLSFDQYIEVLETNGVYLQTREEIRRQMTLQELQRGMVNQRIAITDQEIDNFLNSEMGKEAVAAVYFLDHLLIASTAADSDELKSDKLTYASDLVARLEEEEDFLAVRDSARQAARYIIDGTEFGWSKLDELPRLFGDIVADMEEGQVEGPIEAGNGFHILHLAGIRGGTEQLVNQTNLRHIMLTPNEIRNEEQTIAEIHSLHERIVNGENFASIARQNSDDASSVVGGGDLDWIGEGGMPPEMEIIVDGLEVGELSEPFESQTGWHIAEVLERRVEDLSAEYTRSQAESALRERKFDLELENWLIEIREEAFVEILE